MTRPPRLATDYDRPDEVDAGYRVMLAICLPRDELSVPVIRHLVRDTMKKIGVADDINADIQVALSEACTNVLDHAGPGDAYEVTVTIHTDRCELRVIDVGHGFDHATIDTGLDRDGAQAAERGRGLGLMHALVDHLELASEPEEGTLVRFVKNLAFDETVPGRRLFLR